MMELKNILVPFGGRDDELNALKAAFGLAKIFISQVRVLHVSPDPKMIYASYYASDGMALPPASLEGDMKRHNIASQKAARKKYDAIVRACAIEHNGEIISPDRAFASFHTVTGDAEDIIAIQGRLADLIVMSRTIKDVNVDHESAMMSALFNTGRPVLLIPPGDLPQEIDLRMVIAWNGSAQAARAVNDAMPLLKRAASVTKVWVLTENTSDSKDFPITPDALCLYLKQHGIDAQGVLADSKGLAPGAAILSEAKNLNAGMVVMGAFSHSRIREMILGGVTNFMLGRADLPVFMEH